MNLKLAHILMNLRIFRRIVKYHCVPLSLKWTQPDFLQYGSDDVEKTFETLDEDSRRRAMLFLLRQHLSSWMVRGGRLNMLLVPAAELKYFSKSDYETALREERLLKAARKRYRCRAYSESLVWHHGLKYPGLNADLKSYLAAGDFLDVGACGGDSSIVFLQHSPRKIYAFEPERRNCESFLNLMQLNGVDPARYELIPRAVGSSVGSVHFEGDGSSASISSEGSRVEMTTLDHYLREHAGIRPVLIKADIEGFGLHMLRGAAEVIRKHRPVLLLAIYHNPEEFFGQYRFLESLGLNYRYHIVPLQAMVHELTLIAYPAELGK